VGGQKYNIIRYDYPRPMVVFESVLEIAISVKCARYT
jgi:hypothetical protein